MNNSAERNNPEVFPGNRTGGIHCRKSLISSSNKKRKKHNTTKNKKKPKKNKQKPAITKKCIQRSKQETERFVSNCKQKKPL